MSFMKRLKESQFRMKIEKMKNVDFEQNLYQMKEGDCMDEDAKY
jgi:hypothetical protein